MTIVEIILGVAIIVMAAMIATIIAGIIEEEKEERNGKGFDH